MTKKKSSYGVVGTKKARREISKLQADLKAASPIKYSDQAKAVLRKEDL